MKKCYEGDIDPYRGEGGKKIPFFKFIEKGTYSHGGRGQNLFVSCSIFNFVFLFALNL